jgi:hypothetical protein
MSLRKLPTMTPRKLAANAANAQKSTGPRTLRGKFFSSANGRKGGRPPTPGGECFLRRAAEAEGRIWGPRDPGFMRLVLEGMRRDRPNEFATIIRYRPEYRRLLGMEPDDQ